MFHIANCMLQYLNRVVALHTMSCASMHDTIQAHLEPHWVAVYASSVSATAWKMEQTGEGNFRARREKVDEFFIIKMMALNPFLGVVGVRSAPN